MGYGDFNDGDDERGMSDLLTKAVFHLGNRENREWSQLVAKFAIKTTHRDYLDHTKFGAEFDSRGFTEVMQHMYEALSDPQANAEYGFDVEKFAASELTKLEGYRVPIVPKLTAAQQKDPKWLDY